jgi:hypothetical protein
MAVYRSKVCMLPGPFMVAGKPINPYILLVLNQLSTMSNYFSQEFGSITIAIDHNLKAIYNLGKAI